MTTETESAALHIRISEAERALRSKVLVYCAGEPALKTLSAHDTSAAYELLRGSSIAPRIDLILHTPGGLITAARRLLLVIREFCRELHVHVPHRARSAGTLLCLGADRIFMTPLSELGPLDPQIRSTGSAQAGPASISTEDIRLLPEMAVRWFGLRDQRGRAQSLDALCQRIFPTTLTSVYRADAYLRRVAVDLLGYQLKTTSLKKRGAVVSQLISSYPDHDHGFDRHDLRKMGLSVEDASPQLEAHLWGIYQSALASMEEQSKRDDAGPVTGLMATSGKSAHYTPGSAAIVKGSTVTVDAGRWHVRENTPQPGAA